MFLEFGHVQIGQVLDNCHLLFDFQDIKRYIEIWRNVYANNILVALHEVFNDFSLNVSELRLIMVEENEIVNMDWVEISDDSLMMDFQNSVLLENADMTINDTDTSQLTEDEKDTSAVLETIAMESSNAMDYHPDNEMD